MSIARESIPYEALGRPIQGPSALSHDWKRMWHLTYNIALTQWKMKFFGSVLGYVWQLMRPLLLFGVLYVFFTVVSNVSKGLGASGDFYGSQLLASIVLYTLFAEATGSAVRSVVDSENLVRKIQFPRLVIPLSVVLVALFNLTLNMVVVLVFALIEGVRPMVTWLEAPLLIALLAVLATGVAMILSAMYVYFRDVQPIWDVFLQIIFYASPVIIPIDKIAHRLGPTLTHLYMLNPLAFILQQFRHSFITRATPSGGALLGSQAAVVEPVALIFVIFVFGFYVFNRTAPHVAEDL